MRPRSSLAEAIVRPSFFFRVPEKTPRTVWRCHPVALATSSTVAPSGRRSIAMTSSRFEGRFASGSGSGSGNASIADHSSSISAAVADPPALFSTGQSIPQRQQPLAAEWGGVQFVIRRDDNLAVAYCGRHLATQRNSVIGDDVDAHRWVLLVGPGSGCRR